MKRKKKPGDINSDDTDEGVFKVISIGLSCEDCIRRRIKKCPHTAGRLPSWKSEERQAFTEELMQGNQARMHRELHGAIAGSSTFCFNLYTKDLFARRPYVFDRPPKFLHLGIDPAGGGAGSDHSYVLTASENGNDVIVAFQAMNSADPNEVNDMFRALFSRIRHPTSYYREAIVLVYVEVNMSYLIGNAFSDLFKGERRIFGRCEFEMHYRSKEKDESPGVLTGEKEKAMYVEYTQRMMAGGKLRFADKILGDHNRLLAQKPDLYKQLDAYRRVKKISLDPAFVDDKYTYTGKSSGRRDDLCMALQIALYNMKKKRVDREHIARCQKAGWEV